MTRLIALIILVLQISSLCGQTVQRGYVKEYLGKSQPKPMGGVELNIRRAQSTVSGSDGSFALEFLTLSPGKHVDVGPRDIAKSGYEVFDKKSLEQWALSSDHPFTITMVRSDRFRELCDTYYAAASPNYRRQRDREVAELRRLKEEKKIKEEEYLARLTEAEELYEKQLSNLDNYVDRFARIDLSALSEAEQQIIELVQKGEFDEAIARYEALNLMDKLIAEIDKRDEIASARARLAEAADTVSSNIDNLYASIQNQIDMLKLAGGRENNLKVCDLYCTIADRDTTNIAWLLETGKFLSDVISSYDRALHYYNRALNEATKAYGPEHPDVATALNNIGLVYSEQGNYEKALENHTKALEIWERNFGPEHPDVATALNNIGTVYGYQGNYEKALENHIKALEIDKNAYGPEHPNVATSLNNIGAIHSEQGDYEKALENHTKALEIWEKNFGPEHPSVATSLNNIGLIYSEQGNYEKALENHTKALGIWEKNFGPEHPDVATSLNNIGLVYSNQGNYEDALENYTKALEIREKILGPEHPKVARMLNNIGSVYQDQWNYEKAMENYTKSLEIREKIFGLEHPDVASSLNNIGTVYSDQGNYEKALEYYSRALEIFEKNFGPEHPDVATSLNNIGLVYSNQGNYEDALENYTKALEIREKILGPEHPAVAKALNNIGMVYSHQRNYEKALANFVKALEIEESIFGSEHPDVIIMLNNIVLSLYLCAENNPEYKGELDKFMADKVWIGTVADSSAAAQRGMVGEYVLLEYGDWAITDESYLPDVVSGLRGKPKRIVAVQGDEVRSETFDNQVGMGISLKQVSADEKSRIVSRYKNMKADE